MRVNAAIPEGQVFEVMTFAAVSEALLALVLLSHLQVRNVGIEPRSSEILANRWWECVLWCREARRRNSSFESDCRRFGTAIDLRAP